MVSSTSSPTRRSLLLGGAALVATSIAGPSFSQPAPRSTVTLLRQSTGLYVRTSWRADPSLDQVRRFLVDRPASRGGSQCLDDVGLGLIPATTPAERTAEAFDEGALILAGNEDQAAPAVFNDDYLGANHGIAGWRVLQSSHGLTNADIGSVWNDGAFDFVLAEIVDADHVALVTRATGDDEKWVRPMAPPQRRLTRVSGATASGRLSLNGTSADIAFRNLHPILQAYEQTLLADGARPVPMGVSTCDEVVLSERYRIPNIKAVIERLVSSAGSEDEPSYNDSGIQSQAGVEVSYRLDWTGGVEGAYGFTALQASRMGSGSYLGGMQMHRPLFPGETSFAVPVPEGWTRSFYAFGASAVFDLAGAPQPGDFTEGLDVTPQPQVPFYAVRSESWGSIDGRPVAPDRFVQLVERSGAPQHGLVFGYDERQGDAEPGRRAELTDVACTISPVDKMYPQFRNSRAGDMAAGESYRVGFFYGNYAPTDPEWIAELLAPAGEGTRLYLQRKSGAPLRRWVPCDHRLIGRRVVVDRTSDGVEVLSGVVSEQGVEVSFPAEAGSLDLRLLVS